MTKAVGRIELLFRKAHRCFPSRLTYFSVIIFCCTVFLILYHETPTSGVPSRLWSRVSNIATDSERYDVDMRRPLPKSLRTNGQWRVHDMCDDKLVSYSAFYDDRPAGGVTPWIRIVAVAKLVHKTLYCHVWYPQHEEPYITTVVVTVIGRSYGYVIRNTTYIQYLLSCQLPATEPVPTSVSVVADRNAQSLVYVPVERPVRAEGIEFGVCVAISFGHIPTPEFVEWMELTWMLGVREFNVYDAGMVNMFDVFDLYIRRGWLRVHPMPPPVPVEPFLRSPHNHEEHERRQSAVVESMKLASPASLNDCMMRNVYRYRYTVVIDFDEIIVPRVHHNYSQLIERINLNYSVDARPHTYMFHNTYFFRDLTPDVLQPAHMRTAIFRRSAPPSKLQVAPKSFVDPRTCLAVFNHHCYMSLLPANSSRRRLDVSPHLARSHHYRLCGFSKEVCVELFNQTTLDNVTLKFKWRLQPAVEAAMAELNVSTV